MIRLRPALGAGLGVWLALAILLPCPTSAATLERVLPLNVKISGSVEVDGGSDAYAFDAVAGLELTVTLSGGDKNVLPTLALTDPTGSAVPVPPPGSSGKTKLKKYLLTHGGRYRLLVTVAQAGSYSLKLKAKAAKREDLVTVPESGEAEIDFQAFPGTGLEVRAGPGEKKGPAPVFVSLRDEDGASVDPGKRLKSKSSGFRIKPMDLTRGGAYRLAVRLEGGAGGSALVRITLTDPPKAGKLREEDLVSGIVRKTRDTDPEDAVRWVFRAALLDTPNIDSVTLEIPGRDARPLERDTALGLYVLEESFDDQASLDGDFPDGDYVIRIARLGGDADLTIDASVGGAFPADPLVSSPADGAMGVELAPTLTWAEIAGVAGYEAEVTREGISTVLHSFATDDASETSTTVRTGALLDGPVYRLALSARTDSGKVSRRETRFTTATSFGYSSASAEKTSVRRQRVVGTTGDTDWHLELRAALQGTGILRARLEYAATLDWVAIPPEESSAGFALALRLPDVLDYGTYLVDLDAPEGDFEIRITYLDGSEEVTGLLPVGGEYLSYHKWQSAPRDGSPANVLTPTWNWSQNTPSSDPRSDRTYRIQIEDSATGEMVREEEVAGIRTLPTSYSGIYTVPAGVLEKKHEYKFTVLSDNGEGRVVRDWMAFTTGSELNVPSVVSVSKEHHRDGSGTEEWVFLAEVGGVSVKKARVRDSHGQLFTLRAQADGLQRLRLRFPTQEALDQSMPDGTYTLDFEYLDGTPDRLRSFTVDGDYPSFPEITTPTQGAKNVAKDPGIAWTFPPDEVGGLLAFYVRIQEVKTGLLGFARSLATNVFDTKVPIAPALRKGQKQELSVYAVGPRNKNSASFLTFTTR